MDSMIEIKKTPEFEDWYKCLRDKEQTQIDARLQRIENAGHFGDAKYLGDGLAELRWKNGWRVYFFKESLTGIILLIGGSKNAQEKDIQRARLLLRRYADFKS
jgi:putative addiction module killer protein